MRLVALLAAIPLFLAGCADGADPSTGDEADDALQATPEPVAIHDTVPLVQGGQRTWSFEIAPGATAVEMRFFATGVPGTSLSTCLTGKTPAGPVSVCQAGSLSVQVTPDLLANEHVFYEMTGTGSPVGSYTFTLESAPSAADFHAMVTVNY